jgi:hypothetical protein
MFCRECSNRLDAGSLFCANCGAKASSSASGPGSTPEKEHSIVESFRKKGFVESLQPKGFFESLFDFSFTFLLTTRLVRFWYVASMIVLALGLFFLVIAAFKYGGFVEGVVTLVFWTPLLFVFSVSFIRVIAEVLIVVFRIAEHAAEIAQQGRIKEMPGEIKSSSQ